MKQVTHPSPTLVISTASFQRLASVGINLPKGLTISRPEVRTAGIDIRPFMVNSIEVDEYRLAIVSGVFSQTVKYIFYNGDTLQRSPVVGAPYELAYADALRRFQSQQTKVDAKSIEKLRHTWNRMREEGLLLFHKEHSINFIVLAEPLLNAVLKIAEGRVKRLAS